jgi:16S rRNA (adenine1518-N6/adenine1519-N6)-dimethyltransferase
MTRGFRPRKRFGQHFLESAWADRVIEGIAPRREDRFIEIGPGTGALTTRLARRVDQLTAIEVDRDLAAALEREAPPNVRILTADVLEIDPSVLGAGPIRIAGNLPYNISSPVLFRLFDWTARSDSIVDATVMVQQEFADRLTASVGTKDYGVLTIFAAIAADVRLLFELPPGAFRPVPRVRSSLVHLRFRPSPVRVDSPQTLERVIRSIFTQRRKMLGNAARAVAEAHHRNATEALAAAGIDSTRRPETLTLVELARLANVLAAAP